MTFENAIGKEILTSRVKSREDKDIRSSYYRDTTAILHCSPFRRLKHKTQVFFAPSNDHICTRMEHVLHVASIAAAICKGLALDDELAWAIGLGHDLGHTPFGHVGERILSSMMKEKGFTGFEHEVNSLRVVDFLTPLNLSYAVRDGIVSHCGESFLRTVKPSFEIKDFSKIVTKKGIMPGTWEGCVVRLSDQISYLGRDFEDAVRLGIVNKNDLPIKCQEILGTHNGEIINTLVEDIICNSQKEGVIGFSEEVYSAMQMMIQFNYRNVYRSSMLNGYENYYRRLMKLIYDYLAGLLEKYDLDGEAYAKEGNILSTAFFKYLAEMKDRYIEHDGNLDRVIFDYISGMSDNFCLECGNEILKPEHLNQSINASQNVKVLDAVDKFSSSLAGQGSLFPL